MPGGIKLALLPKKTRGGTVFVGLTLRFGDREEPGQPSATCRRSTTAMLMRGTSKHTRQQIEDEFDRLKARVSINGWGSGMYVQRRDHAREPARR